MSSWYNIVELISIRLKSFGLSDVSMCSSFSYKSILYVLALSCTSAYWWWCAYKNSGFDDYQSSFTGWWGLHTLVDWISYVVVLV